MRTFFARHWYHARSTIGIGSLARRPARLPRLAALSASAGSQDGFLLIEVLISTLLVGVMVIATYNGLDSINRSTAEQRRHNEAAELAIQSQEQLRSDTATALLELPSAGHSYTVTVGGTQYTVTQKASYGNGGEQTGCNATETKSSGTKGTYILISSSITWPHAKVPVTESSIITPPTGSALKVNVTNGSETPTPGVPVTVTYEPVGTESLTTIEATTGASGCALFAGIPATAATIAAKETQGIVTKWGSLHLPATKITLAPNVLTEWPLTLAPGGRLEAEFRWGGATSYTHKGNGGVSTVTEPVTGDTFVALNTNMGQAPDFETGSNQNTFTMSGNLYEVLPDTAGGAYEATSTTPQEPIKYPQGNLFPFAKQPWTAYAGDCTYNNPVAVTEAARTTVVNPETKEVIAGGSATVPVPMTYVELNVYHKKTQAEIVALGSKAWEWLETTNSYPVTITNKKCAGVEPNNETTLNTRHTQSTTTGSLWGGHLADPFQPFGEYELCLYAAGKTYTVKPYTNISSTTAASITRKIYLEELSNKEKETARKNSEAATKSTREAAEAPGREKREKEEKTEKETKTSEEAAKTARLAAEATEKSNWEREVRLNGKSASTKEREDREKESAQAAKRAAAEETERTAEAKRKAEETTTAGIKTTETTTRKTAETAEKAAETAAITAENKEISEKEVAVESGKSSC